MLFHRELNKSAAKTFTLEDLGEELRSLDKNELESRLAVEDQRKQYANYVSQVKKEELEKIKNNLEAEKKSYQQACKVKHEEAIKTPHLTQIQQERFTAALQEKLREYEASMIRKYEQFAKQLEDQNELSKQKFSEERQNKLDKQITQNAIKRESIKNELRRFLVTEQTAKLAAFITEFNHKIKEIDDEITENVNLVNNDVRKIVLDEYKKIDIYLYNTLNDLAQKYLVCKRDELKLALAIRLSQLTDYRLDESLKLAEKVVTNLSIQVTSKEKNKISFELITRNIEKELNLNPEKNHFKDILLAIKEECFNFTERTEYLFTCYFYAKKQEYGNRISSIASDDLLAQDNARRYFQEQVLDYLLKHINPKDFYLTFVNLGIEAMQAKIRDREDKHSMADFNIHQDQVLRELNDELNETYDNFFIENEISPVVKEKLNHAEIKKFFFQILTKGYMKHKRDNIYILQNNLTAAQVLAELEDDFEKQKLILSSQSTDAKEMQRPEDTSSLKITNR